jgi:hypothetical protein
VAPALIALCAMVFYWAPMTSRAASIQWDAADLHYPLQKYFSDRLLSGQLPFWTPYLFSGYPILANPEVGAWYPPHWPFFLTGIAPRSIQFELALNAFLACLGAYFLISRHVASRAAAVLGALAYGLSGFFAGHSSHVGLFSAAAGFPWLLLAYRRAADSAALRYTALGGIAGGAIILAGYAQTAVFGFLGLGLYALADLGRDRRRWLRTAAIVGGMLAGALACAAIQILPGLELVSHSIRAASGYATSTEGILHAPALMTLVAPDWLGVISDNYSGPFDRTQYYFYAGLFLLPLAALGAVKTRARLPALLLIVPPAWYMLGPAGGFYRLVTLAPGLNKFRAPIQGWFLVAFGLALLAAAGGSWLFARWRIPYLGILVAAVFFADLWYSNSFKNPLAYARASFEELYGAHEEMGRKQVAASQPPLTRFDGPRNIYALGPQDHPLDLKLEATYGYFALEPALYDEYADAIERNPKLRDGLNVSRFLNMTSRKLDSNPSVLARAYFPKAVADVSSLAESRQALETLDPRAQSVVLLPHSPVRQDPAATASVVSYDEQSYRIRYHAASPSLLKLSVTWYPGWRATLNGGELPVVRVDHALMGVVVPAGDAEVEFRFHSNYFGAGLAITLMAAMGLGLLAWRSRGGPGLQPCDVVLLRDTALLRSRLGTEPRT